MPYGPPIVWHILGCIFFANMGVGVVRIVFKGDLGFPDTPTLAFFFFSISLLFSFLISLAFFNCFPFFSKDWGGCAKRETLAFFGVSLVFFWKQQVLEGQGIGASL